MPIWNCILQQNVQVSCSKDSWKWKCSSTGEINFKSSWELVRNSDPQYQFSKLVWFPSYSAKMAICLCRTLHGKLLTRDFLISLGISNTNTCVLCNSDTESICITFSLHALILHICRLYADSNWESKALLILCRMTHY